MSTFDPNAGAIIADTTAAYRKIVLDSLVYWYNPKPSVNPVVTSIGRQPTLDGANFTIWGDPSGNPIVQDREIVQTWDAMEQPFYKQLEAKLLSLRPLTLVDEFGVSYTVLFVSLPWTGSTAGGAILLNVVATFYVVSSP